MWYCPQLSIFEKHLIVQLMSYLSFLEGQIFTPKEEDTNNSVSAFPLRIFKNLPQGVAIVSERLPCSNFMNKDTTHIMQLFLLLSAPMRNKT